MLDIKIIWPFISIKRRSSSYFSDKDPYPDVLIIGLALFVSFSVVFHQSPSSVKMYSLQNLTCKCHAERIRKHIISNNNTMSKKKN